MFSLEKRREKKRREGSGDLIDMHQYLRQCRGQGQGSEEERASCFSLGPHDRASSSGHKLKYCKSHLNTQKTTLLL